ncbi:TolB family protein [Lentibacillus jeotgali]|uniref:TolB family protein n=1 Tax=Lentibacillus jeotgali TaxID=558169 RepID=UPI0002626BB3|nr:PD40 domain-containing protein [Lentibacillus jeotgali]
MSLKMKNFSFITGIVLLFFILRGAGSFAGAPEGFSGFGQSTDISPDDSELVFSYFHGDDAALYTVPVSGGEAELLAKPDEGKSYINPKFSPDGDKIVFVEQWEEGEKEQKRRYSQLRIVDRTDQTVEILMNTRDYITEAAFSPDGELLYFLKAGVYKNYSPITSERPHDFDMFRMDLKTKEIEQLTSKKAYSMSSLELSSDGDRLMYKTYGNRDQLVLRSLKNGKEETIVPAGDFASKEPIISSPTLSPDGEHAVFSDVAATDENGTFVYEGFRMDLDTRQAEQITSFHEHVSSPVFFHKQDKLIVTINKNFAGADPEYSYWQISADGEERNRITIAMPEE